MIALDKTIENIDNVFYFLDMHRAQAATRLFHTKNEEYLEEWITRSPFRFWVHLDQSNKRKLVDMAREHYAEVRG